MKHKRLNISLYWKCQLAGWSIFYITSIFFAAIRNVSMNFIAPAWVLASVIGMLISHLMKYLMKKLRVVQASILYQAVWILFSSLIFSTVFLFLSNFIIIPWGWINLYINVLKGDRIYLHAFFLNLIMTVLIFLIWNLFYFAYNYVQKAKKEEHLKFNRERELLEMEAKALRAQMNPHFIFNCLNSIKSLIQQNENEKSVTYLTTFSKLIRNLLNNADKKEISLFDEIATCKLYLQLEAMRFDTKFSYTVNVDDTIDLKSIQVPALIIQPFIENAIWHGIVPRNTGGKLLLNVLRKDGVIEIIIDDDGIGREASQQNKSASGLVHQSKGVNLTQTRLELNNLLQQKQAELEVIDKRDEYAVAAGTTIIIKIKEELS